MKLKPMKLLWLFLLPIILYLGYVILVIAFGTFNDYQPEEVINIPVNNNQEKLAVDSNEFTFLIWNVGYGGLGNESDFFLDGGTQVRPTKDLSKRYIDGIISTVSSHNDIDFLLLQEVDVKAKRSYQVNEFQEIANNLPQHTNAHAFNFNVKFVPKPLVSLSPIGQVQSGLATYSKYKVSESNRFQFPGSYDWPVSVFHLDRCILETRVPLTSGKELIVINSHNSAYDGGKLKPQEMAYLKEHLLAEYNKGNYVIVGGDWNQCPPNFNYDTFSKVDAEDYYQDNIAEDFMPTGWEWAFDNTVPTNRKLAAKFEKGKTFTTLIDFYLISPNISLIEVEGVNLDFENSDHQPVKLKIQLQ